MGSARNQTLRPRGLHSADGPVPGAVCRLWITFPAFCPRCGKLNGIVAPFPGVIGYDAGRLTERSIRHLIERVGGLVRTSSDRIGDIGGGAFAEPDAFGHANPKRIGAFASTIALAKNSVILAGWKACPGQDNNRTLFLAIALTKQTGSRQ